MRLKLSSLEQAHAQIKPSQRSLGAGVGIVHLGFGAFHRAHQALITDTAMREHGGDWKIVGVSWGRSGVEQQLAPQDNLYSVGVGYNDDLAIQIVGSVHEILTAKQSDQVLKYMSSPAVKIVSLTVTEKGYCHLPATGDLDLSHPLIVHDLANIDAPQSAVGFIVAALKTRQQNGIKAFTPMSCDNLPENGHVLEKVVLQFAKQLDENLYQWIKQQVSFPCTMVDRIVPRTTEQDVAKIEHALGLEDQGCVMTEPFLQWVIEDKFVDGRPQWEATSIDNVQITENVAAFEEMKLRLLNGTHSAMAYLGYLAGYQTVAQTIHDSDFARFIRNMMDVEITPSIAIQDVDLEHYKDQLIARYQNTALQHRTWQIAMDGSQKLPQRLLRTLDYALAHQISTPCIYLTVAAWMTYVSGVDEQGQTIDVQDPLSEQFAAIWQQYGQNLPTVVSKFLAIDKIFSPQLARNPEVIKELTHALEQIVQHGAKASVSKLLQ
ncbi:fructuronate reductase [Vibrio xiamenensis]|uniref:Fructuronate reductase n=1 Tax=Vibrio xiamenensis TaxID=861298 RepID=A0A1G7ZZT2_9VIBR|nr:mannitol dehydrogenase family protein [Vibrio xiamenensis]SDH14151.1 fructuronate reductase [Vibrio xiamenensis]